MFQGSWKCSKCGGEITELPFQPRSEAGLTCRACYAKGKQAADEGVSAPTAAPDMSDAPVANDAPVYDPNAAPAPDTQEAPPFETEGQLDDSGQAETPAKKQFSGEWTCSVCGGAIASLPFEPRSTNNLKCLECFKAGK